LLAQTQQPNPEISFLIFQIQQANTKNYFPQQKQKKTWIKLIAPGHQPPYLKLEFI
jgi:hypothetical protein